MNMYYHVRIDYYDKLLKVNQTLFQFDYKHDSDVINEVTEPFIREHEFYFKGVKLQASNIRQLQVFSSESLIEDCLEIVNSQIPRNVIMAYGKEEILPYKNLVNEVTNDIIKTTQNYVHDMEQKEKDQDMSVKQKKPMAFISHNHDDIDLVHDLCDLLQDIGLDKTNLFCSSIPGLWIGLSKDIFESLRSLFQDYNLFVIFVQTPNYYKSPISLNEMGAAWVLQTEFCSILSKDMQYDDLKGVFDKTKTAIKVDEPVAKDRLDELKNNVLTFLEMPAIEDTDASWIRHRDNFLRSATK